MCFAEQIHSCAVCSRARQIGGQLKAVLLCVGLLVVTTGTSRGGPMFAARYLSYGLAAFPSGAAIGDVNGDEELDLVTSNREVGSVFVLLGNADGTFRAAVDYATGDYPVSIAMGDLNGDGKPDLVTTNPSGTVLVGNGYETRGILSVLLGNGDGTFGAAVDYVAGEGAQCAAIGDLNGDGKPDLVATGQDSVSVLLGNGDGSFAAYLHYATGHGPSSVAIGDLNGDGKPDLVTTNAALLDNTVSVLLGNGDGTFAASVDYGVSAIPDCIAIGDLNGDGKPDLVAGSSSYSLQGAVSVLLGSGDGTFSAAVQYGSANSVQSVAIGDLNADGKPDLAASSNENVLAGVVSVLLGNGDGTFGANVDYGVGREPRCVAIGDLNGDGKPDLVTANAVGSSSGMVTVVLGHGDGTFGAAVDQHATGDSPQSVAIADLDRDGSPDLVTANYNASTVSILLGNGAGAYGPKADFGTGDRPRCVAIGDLNRDGIPDLVTANYIASTVSVLLGNGDGTFGAKADYAAGAGPYSVAIGDLNGDGKPDLVTANSAEDSLSVLLGNGEGAFGAKVSYAVGNEPRSIAVFDLNRDGKPDLVTANYWGGVSVLLGKGGGTFGAKTDYETGANANSIAIADLNGDGTPDLVTANSGNLPGSVSVFLGVGDGTFGTRAQYRAGEAGASVAIGDLNGDGNFDLVTAGWSGTTSVLLGKGDGSFGASTDYGIGATPLSVAIGDLNRDGRPDLVTANPNEDTASILLNLSEPATAVTLATLRAEATAERVRIEWYAPGDRIVLASVYRRTPDSDWVLQGHPEPDLNRRIIYEDSAVTPGIQYGYRLIVRDAAGYENTIETWVTVPGGKGLPAVLRFGPIRPNPFGGHGELSYGLPQGGRVRLAIYDVQGRLVATIVDGVETAGWRSVVWDGRDRAGRPVASGAYFARLEAGDAAEVRKVLVAR